MFVEGIDDSRIVRIALDEERVLLTKDTRMMERRVITTGRLKAVLIETDDVMSQVRQVFNAFSLSSKVKPFSLCIECNEPLLPRKRDEVKEIVPPYVLRTQTYYMQCPNCQRVYWRGTHWERMSRELKTIVESV
jgi:uncharacterized protein with PIN domain